MPCNIRASLVEFGMSSQRGGEGGTSKHFVAARNNFGGVMADKALIATFLTVHCFSPCLS
eukprot:3941102-Rhodomonas_salina.4